MQSVELDRLVASLRDIGAGEGLQGVCREAASLVGVTDVSFALIGAAGQRHTLCSSSERSAELDRWQFSLDQGPCLRAAKTGEAIAAPTTDPGVEWPQLAQKADQLGYGAIGGVPLAVAGVTFGAMNIQVDGPDISAQTVERASALAEKLSPALLDHVTDDDLSSIAESTDRAVIHQATGIVAGQLGTSIEDAVAALRARAWSDDRLLEDLAEDIASGAVRLDRP